MLGKKFNFNLNSKKSSSQPLLRRTEVLRRQQHGNYSIIPEDIIALHGKERLENSWTYFPLELQKKSLIIDSVFLKKLSPKSKIIEIGSGTGRLADYILNHSEINPVNYTMVDLDYALPRSGPFLNRHIFELYNKSLKSKGKKGIELIAESAFKFQPSERVEHIIISNIDISTKTSDDLISLFKKLSNSVVKGGTIRFYTTNRKFWTFRKSIEIDGFKIIKGDCSSAKFSAKFIIFEKI
ncbi:MAG: hypothetical protein V1824_03495 [archaeon]